MLAATRSATVPSPDRAESWQRIAEGSWSLVHEPPVGRRTRPYRERHRKTKIKRRTAASKGVVYDGPGCGRVV